MLNQVDLEKAKTLLSGAVVGPSRSILSIGNLAYLTEIQVLAQFYQADLAEDRHQGQSPSCSTSPCSPTRSFNQPNHRAGDRRAARSPTWPSPTIAFTTCSVRRNLVQQGCSDFHYDELANLVDRRTS